MDDDCSPFTQKTDRGSRDAPHQELLTPTKPRLNSAEKILDDLPRMTLNKSSSTGTMNSSDSDESTYGSDLEDERGRSRSAHLSERTGRSTTRSFVNASDFYHYERRSKAPSPETPPPRRHSKGQYRDQRRNAIAGPSCDTFGNPVNSFNDEDANRDRRSEDHEGETLNRTASSRTLDLGRDYEKAGEHGYGEEEFAPLVRNDKKGDSN